MSLKEAEQMALQTLKNVMEEKIHKHNVEVATVSIEDKRFRIHSFDHVAEIIEKLT